MSKDKIVFSVVVLCYRSEEKIIPFIENLKILLDSICDNWEIVMVGNYIEGSNDRTKDIIKNLAEKDNRLKTVIKPKKGMMGWDMREGMQAASGEYICIIDGDGQYPIESIKECYKIIVSENFDMVKTYRIKRFDGFYRASISKIYNFLFNILFSGLSTNDANSKPKILTREAYNKMILTSNDWFIDAEIMINIRRLKLKFKEIPINFYKINDRTSFVKVNAIFEFIKNLFLFRLKEFFNIKID